MAQMVQPIGVSLFLPSVGVEGHGLTAPELVMLANVALTSEGSGPTGTAEEKQMVELTTVGNSCYSESEDEIPLCCATDRHGETPAKGEAGYPRGAEGQAVPGLLESSPISTGLKRKRGPCPAEDPRAKKKPFHCKPCQYQAECEEEFFNHISLHSAKKLMAVGQVERETAVGAVEGAAGGKGVIRCERCGYNTNRYDHYTAHLKHHSKGGDSQKVYKCTICTYTTVSQYHWKKHLRNHFPSKLYTCAQCCYFSDRKNNYVQHIRTHTGERPFQCPYCEYTSSQKTHLTRHMRTHSGEKPFKCDSCCYVAANQHEVTRHARQVHGGPKPLSCPHCPYKTADRSNYKKHVELHVSPRQFLCPVCSYAASKKCNLQYHIKSRHPDCAEVTMDVSKVKLRVKSPDPGTTRGSRCQPAEVEEEGAPPVERPEIKMDSDQAEREGSGEEEVADSKCSSLPADGVVKPVAVEREHGDHDCSRAEQEPQKEDVDEAKSTEMSLEQKKGVGRRGAKKGEGRCEVRGRSGSKPPRSPANTALKEELDNCYTDRPERRRARDGRNTGEPSKPKEPVPKTRPKRECKSSVSCTDEKGTEEETGSREKTPRSLSKPSGSVVGTARRQVSQEPLRKTRKEAKTRPGMRKSDVMGPFPLEYKNAEESSSSMRSTRRQAESQAQCQGLVLQNKRNGLRSHSKAEAKEEFSTEMDQPAGVKVRKTTKGAKKNPSLAEKQTAGKVDGVVESLSTKQSPVIEPLLMNLDKPVPLMITCEHQVAPVVIAPVKVDSGVKAPKSPGPQYEKIRIKQQKGKRDESKDTLKRRSMVKAAEESEEVERKGRRPRLQLPPAPGEHLDTEDEGIHSPNGSEVSDSVSEGSDDSGLNGLTAAPSPSVQSEMLDKQDTPCPSVQSEILTKPDTPSQLVQSEMLAKRDTPNPSVQSEMLAERDTPNPSVQSEMLAKRDTPSPLVQSEMLTRQDTPSQSVQSEMLTKQDTPSPLVQSEMLAKRDTPVLSGQSKMLTEPESPSLVVQSGVLAKPAIVSEANLINSQSRTCIFCDRIFPLEVEYRRHLNRHLVNIYYL